MTLPEWLPLIASGVLMLVWRRIVLGWLRAGRLAQRPAAAAYAAIIPVLVLVAFTFGGLLGPTALLLAALGFALSYGFALLAFRGVGPTGR